jgi:hypothetical protein
VLQHPARRDRAQAVAPVGEAGAREDELEPGRAVGRALRHDLVTISGQQPLPAQRHRGEPLHGRAAREYLLPRERDQHTQGLLQSGGRDPRLQAHPQARGSLEAGTTAGRLHAPGTRRGHRRGQHGNVNLDSAPALLLNHHLLVKFLYIFHGA